MKKGIYLILGIFLSFVSCNEDDVSAEEQRTIDENLIQGYIGSNGLTANNIGDGLYVVIDSAGSGNTPTSSDFVAVHYEGFLLDGQKFDSSRDRKALSVFGLNQVIPGFRLGLLEFAKSGSGTIIIPSHLAYGNNPPGGIPANAVLIFEITLFDFGAAQDVVQKEADDISIRQFLADEGIEALSTDEGLYYTIDVEGTGPNPTSSDQVTVNYEGFLLTGDKFDSSLDRGTPATFSLENVIQGWQLGIPLLKEGGRGKLFIPSHLAYGGNSPQGSIIPPFAILQFDVELLKVGP